MPYKKINDINVYYEIHGPSDGTPLICLEGWGTSLWCWFRQLPEFSKRHRVLIFDNRGVGKTSKPDEPYSIQMFADDANGLIEAVGIEKVHVLGISMGGFIAQQFAISYPERVLSLILGQTSFGDGNGRIVQRTNKTLAAMIAIPTETISQEQAMAIKRSVVYSENFLRTNHSLMKQIEKWILENPQPLYALAHQSQAVSTFDSENEIGKITVPTLLLHGEKDLAIPSQNAEMLLESIPNSRLILFKDGPHRIEIERYKDYNKAVLEYLAEVDTGTFKPDPKKIII